MLDARSSSATSIPARVTCSAAERVEYRRFEERFFMACIDANAPVQGGFVQVVDPGSQAAVGLHRPETGASHSHKGGHCGS